MDIPRLVPGDSVLIPDTYGWSEAFTVVDANYANEPGVTVEDFEGQILVVSLAEVQKVGRR